MSLWVSVTVAVQFSSALPSLRPSWRLSVGIFLSVSHISMKSVFGNQNLAAALAARACWREWRYGAQPRQKKTSIPALQKKNKKKRLTVFFAPCFRLPKGLWNHTSVSSPSHWWPLNFMMNGFKPPSELLLSYLCHGMLRKLENSPKTLFSGSILPKWKMATLIKQQRNSEPCFFFLFDFHSIQDMDKRLQALMAACEKLPTDNLNNFRSVTSPTFYIFLCVVQLQESKKDIVSFSALPSSLMRHKETHHWLKLPQIRPRKCHPTGKISASSFSPTTTSRQKANFICCATCGQWLLQSQQVSACKF